MAYPSHGRPHGRRYPVSAATFGAVGTRYNSVVRAVTTEAGLYLHVVFLFRAFHPPFTLPWSSIERVEPYSFLWTQGYVLHVRDEVGSFQMHVGRAMAPELGRFVPHLFAAVAS